jgi:hypothetical protein
MGNAFRFRCGCSLIFLCHVSYKVCFFVNLCGLDACMGDFWEQGPVKNLGFRVKFENENQQRQCNSTSREF